MHQTGKMKYRLIKIILIIGAIFLGVVAFNDFTPTQTAVEKTVVYEKQ